MRTGFLLFLAAGLLQAQLDRAGLPACSLPTEELAVRSALVLCHSASLRLPVWTAYELTPERLRGDAPRPKRFRRDRRLAQPGAADSDYRASGYVRGHMAPAADFTWNQEAMRDSFLLSNAVPQDARLNSGKWRLLENAVRTVAATADFVIVFTGPVFCHETARIGENGVAVPCELYKVVLVGRDSNLSAFAAILPNDGNPSQPLAAFACSVSEVEKRTGLDFFSALPQDLQFRLESSAQPLQVNQ